MQREKVGLSDKSVSVCVLSGTCRSRDILHNEYVAGCKVWG